jgi:hypothetical protein
MKLITQTIARELVKRDLEVIETGKCDESTVVRFFTPWGSASWEIYSATPLDRINGSPVEDHDFNHAKDWHMFGRCDLGRGSELGYVLLSELKSLRGGPGKCLRVERDIHRSL